MQHTHRLPRIALFFDKPGACPHEGVNPAELNPVSQDPKRHNFRHDLNFNTICVLRVVPISLQKE